MDKFQWQERGRTRPEKEGSGLSTIAIASGKILLEAFLVNKVNYIVEDNGVIVGMPPMPELVREERVDASVKGAFSIVVVTHSKDTVKGLGVAFCNCVSQKNAPIVV